MQIGYGYGRLTRVVSRRRIDRSAFDVRIGDIRGSRRGGDRWRESDGWSIGRWLGLVCRFNSRSSGAGRPARRGIRRSRGLCRSRGARGGWRIDRRGRVGRRSREIPPGCGWDREQELLLHAIPGELPQNGQAQCAENLSEIVRAVVRHNPRE